MKAMKESAGHVQATGNPDGCTEKATSYRHTLLIQFTPLERGQGIHQNYHTYCTTFQLSTTYYCRIHQRWGIGCAELAGAMPALLQCS